MGVPKITTPQGYARGTVTAPDVNKIAQNLSREFAKLERAQPNMRTVQITENYDVDPGDRTILVDTTAGDVTINLRSALQPLILPLDIIKTSSDGHSVQVMAKPGESIGGPLGALTGLVWSQMGIGWSFHPDGVGQWWVEGSSVAWGNLTSVPSVVTTLTAQQLLEARSTITITTGSLADLAYENSNVAMSRHTMALILVEADRACWLRFYGSAAAQTADSGRAIGTVGTAGTGLLGDFRYTASGVIPVSPVAVLANEEGPAQTRVFYTVQNRSGGTSAVVVTLTVIPLET